MWAQASLPRQMRPWSGAIISMSRLRLPTRSSVFNTCGEERQDDVVIVFLDRALDHVGIVFIGETFGGGDVLAEGVVADEELFFGDVGNHAVRPVEHPGFHEMDIALADVDHLARLDHFDGPAGGVELGFHEALAHGRGEIFSGRQRSTSWQSAPA